MATDTFKGSSPTDTVEHHDSSATEGKSDGIQMAATRQEGQALGTFGFVSMGQKPIDGEYLTTRIYNDTPTTLDNIKLENIDSNEYGRRLRVLSRINERDFDDFESLASRPDFTGPANALASANALCVGRLRSIERMRSYYMSTANPKVSSNALASYLGQSRILRSMSRVQDRGHPRVVPDGAAVTDSTNHSSITLRGREASSSGSKEGPSRGRKRAAPMNEDEGGSNLHRGNTTGGPRFTATPFPRYAKQVAQLPRRGSGRPKYRPVHTKHDVVEGSRGNAASAPRIAGGGPQYIGTPFSMPQSAQRLHVPTNGSSGRPESQLVHTKHDATEGTISNAASAPRIAPLEQMKLIRIATKEDHWIDAPIIISLETFPIESTPSYIALSYAWGNSTPSDTVQVNGAPFAVRGNLAAALKQLRRLRPGAYVWTDAICINQSDETEKSHVVQHMGEIFHAATAVYAWLGPAEEEDASIGVGVGDSSDALWEHLRQLGDLFWAHAGPYRPLHETPVDIEPVLDALLPELDARFMAPTAAGGFPTLAYSRFSNRAYWQRVWVLQEVHLARKLIFCCGEKTMGSPTLAGAMIMLESYQKRVASSLRQTQQQEQHPKMREFAFTAPCYPEMHRMLIYTSIYAADVQSLRIAMTNFCVKELPRGAQSTDPRDMVFGLLGFGEEGGCIRVDYARPVTEVYRDTTRALLRRGWTDLLAWAQPAEKRVPGLPSWVPDFSATIHETMCSQAQAKSWLPRFSAAAGVRSASPDIAVAWQRRATIEASENDRSLMVSGAQNTTFSAMSWSATWAHPVFRVHVSLHYEPHVVSGDVDGSWELRWPGLLIDIVDDVGSLWHPRAASISSHKSGAGGATTSTTTANIAADAEMPTRSASFEAIYTLLSEVQGYVDRSINLHPVMPWGKPEDVPLRREAAWRVPCADQLLDDSKLVRGHVDMQRAHQAAFDDAARYIAEAHSGGDNDDFNISEDAVPYIETMLRWVKKRPFLGGRGYVGLAPENTRTGDVVVLLQGCSAPYILRPWSVDGKPQFYELVGEAFVWGLMDGEYLRDGYELTVFDIQ